MTTLSAILEGIVRVTMILFFAIIGLFYIAICLVVVGLCLMLGLAMI